MTGRFSIIALTMTFGLWLAPVASAQQPPADEHAGHHPQAPSTQAPAPQPAPEQTQGNAMQASHARLDALVAEMNSATGTAKVERMAALLTELVAQQQQMKQKMMMSSGCMKSQATSEDSADRTALLFPDRNPHANRGR